MFSHHERVNMAISKSGLPKTVLELFDPRKDLEYKPPIDKKPPVLPLIGLAGYVAHFPDADDPEYQPPRNELAKSEDRKFRSREFYCQVSIGEPSILERRQARVQAKTAGHQAEMEAALATYDPSSDPNTAGTDPMRTLFVSRLDYKTTESDLYAEFEKHGAIRELKLVRTPEGQSRGYAFIEYQHSGDMKKAYKAYPDGSVCIGSSTRRSLVDVERGRTVEGWKPMRLGGGKGGESRLPKPKMQKKGTAAKPAPGVLPAAPGTYPDRDRDRERSRNSAAMDTRVGYRDRGDRDRPQENGWRDRDRFAGGMHRDSRGYGGRAERDRPEDGFGRHERPLPPGREGRVGGGDRYGSQVGNGYRDDRGRYRDDRSFGSSGPHKRDRDDRFGGWGGDGRAPPSRTDYGGDRDRRMMGYGDRDRDAKRGRHDGGHRGYESYGSRDRAHRR